MTIETKYNIGDMVWFIDNNMATQSKIRSIVIEVGGVGSTIKRHILYRMYVDDIIRRKPLVHESNVFPTKEELIAKMFVGWR